MEWEKRIVNLVTNECLDCGTKSSRLSTTLFDQVFICVSSPVPVQRKLNRRMCYFSSAVKANNRLTLECEEE